MRRIAFNISDAEIDRLQKYYDKQMAKSGCSEEDVCVDTAYLNTVVLFKQKLVALDRKDDRNYITEHRKDKPCQQKKQKKL